MSVSFVIPDVQSLARRVAAENPNADRSYVYGMVFEFIRFFRLKQKLGDFYPERAVLAPSYLIDRVWHIFLQDTRQYAQACGSAARFIHHDPNGKQDSTYYTRLARTRDEYIAEYGEDPPSEFWQDEIVLAPATPPLSPSSSPVINRRSNAARMSTRKRDRDTTFSVFLKQISGKTSTVTNLSSETLVRDLYLDASRVTGIPVKDMRLIFAGKTLDERKQLSDLGIISDSTIHMVVQIRGC